MCGQRRSRESSRGQPVVVVTAEPPEPCERPENLRHLRKALLDQTDRQRVAVRLPVVRRDGAHDAEDEGTYPGREDDQKAHQNDREYTADDVGDEQCDLEVQRFFAVLVQGLAALAAHQPDDQRGQPGNHQAPQVDAHTPALLLTGRHRLRAC